jgi:hypothetical protein
MLPHSRQARLPHGTTSDAELLVFTLLSAKTPFGARMTGGFVTTGPRPLMCNVQVFGPYRARGPAPRYPPTRFRALALFGRRPPGPIANWRNGRR